MEQAIPDLMAYHARVVAELGELESAFADLKAHRDKKTEEVRAVETLLMIHDPTFQPTLDRSTGRTLTKRGRSSLPDQAYGVLFDLGAPTYYGDLHDEMIKRGIEIPGQKPAANLLAQMSHDERFVRVERGTYALREWTATHDAGVDDGSAITDEGASAEG